MAKGCELSTDVVCARADLHADQTAWEIVKTPLKLLPRTLQLQNNCTALIEAQMKGVLANIDADCSDRRRR